MSRIVVVTVGAAALLGLGAAAGCGGDDEATDGGETTETSTTSVRLTDEQWSEYTVVRDAFLEANATAQKRLDTCSTAQSASVLQTCVGNVYGELADAARTVGTTLEGFGPSVSGDCAVALGGLVNYVTPYAATADQIQDAADTGNLLEYSSAAEDLEVAADAAADQATTFDEECAPV